MKKGQIQLGESIAVIIIVIIMLILGIAFWSKIDNQNVQDLSDQSNDLAIVEIANTVAEFTELKCYDANVNKVKCLDYYKLKAMANLSNETSVNEFYHNYFRNSKITVQIMYPYSENITIYDAKLSGSTKTLLIPIPINVKDYVNKTTYYGVIVAEGYYEQ